MPAFWDTSAVVHLCVPGQGSSGARRLLHEQTPVIWWCTPVEALGAIERLHADRVITLPACLAAKERAQAMLGSWREIHPSDFVRELALVLLGQFRLRAADALQLAAALVWCKQKPQSRIFVCNDVKLVSAAMALGFDVRSA